MFFCSIVLCKMKRKSDVLLTKKKKKDIHSESQIDLDHSGGESTKVIGRKSRKNGQLESLVQTVWTTVEQVVLGVGLRKIQNGVPRPLSVAELTSLSFFPQTVQSSCFNPK